MIAPAGTISATDDLGRLVELCRELQLPADRDALAKLLRRKGSFKDAERALRARRDRVGREVLRAVDERESAELEHRAGVRYDRHHAKHAAMRAQLRAQRPTLERVSDCFRRARLLPGMATPDVMSGGDGGDSEDALPTGGDSELYDHYEQLLEILTAAFERELDRAFYGGLPETAEQRGSRVISRFRGIPAYIAAALDRTLGSPATVERDRDRHGLRKRDGLPHKDRDDA